VKPAAFALPFAGTAYRVARRMQEQTQEARLVTPEALRGLERDHRDLFLSLRALSALMRDPDPVGPEGEPILARILDAHVHQMGTLVGEITTALRVERHDAGAPKTVDLARVLETAVRRSARRVLVEISDQVQIQAHPNVVAQVLASVIALALRSADGRVTATATAGERDGVLLVRVPGRDAHAALERYGARLDLLRKIVASEGGRLSLARCEQGAMIRVAFPAASARRPAKRGRSA
jgi:hypothetical protein